MVRRVQSPVSNCPAHLKDTDLNAGRCRARCRKRRRTERSANKDGCDLAIHLHSPILLDAQDDRKILSPE